MYVLGGNPRSSASFNSVLEEIKVLFKTAPLIDVERWQGVKAAQATKELRNVLFEIPLKGVEDLSHWKRNIEPNLPWADDHFIERVCGEPLNPGKTWLTWPYANSASKFRKENEQFNHSYCERYWPRYARRTEEGKLPTSYGEQVRKFPLKDPRPKYGISHFYGDLQDVVELLSREPLTRQAYLPIFFPEDTGVGDGGRKPCTLGYHFMVRENQLHICYYMRSCDFIRHYKDDCYLTVRLLLWVIEQCRKMKPETWNKIIPGTYFMQISSLHIFASDEIGV